MTPVVLAVQSLGLSRLDAQPPGFDFVGQVRGVTVGLNIKRLSAARVEELEGRLAHAMVTNPVGPTAPIVPVIVISMPRVTPAAAQCARAFTGRYGPHLQWMLVGDDGDAVVHVPMVGIDTTANAPRRQKRATSSTKKNPAAAFSGLGPWMLKVLLLRDAPNSLWAGPKVSVATVKELAVAAHVSVPHANRFVRELEAEGFAIRSSGGLRLTRIRALVEAWFEAHRLTSRQRVPVRWIMGKPMNLDEVFLERGGIFGRDEAPLDDGSVAGTHPVPTIATTGFAACAAMGLSHATTPGEDVVVRGDVNDVLKRFDLEPCDIRDAHLNLEAHNGPSLWRGVIRPSTGLPHVDAMQAALDVVANPARGREQAEHIVFDILGLGRHE